MLPDLSILDYKRVAIVGSRKFKDLELVYDFVNAMPVGATVISGGAVGVDTTAEGTARSRGIKVISFKPDWNRYGKGAGFVRNSDIVDACDVLVAFWDGSSRGTLDSINKAKAANKHVSIIRPKIITVMEVYKGTRQLTSWQI